MSRKNFKRAALFGLALVLLVAMCLGVGGCKVTPATDGKTESGQGETKAKTDDAKTSEVKKVTLEYLIYEHPNYPVSNNTLVLQKTLEETGIEIKYVPIPHAGYQEKLNLKLATGDLPDLVQMSIALINEHSANGAFIALDNYIEKSAPNIKKIMTTDVKVRVMNIDNKIYGIPLINRIQVYRGAQLARKDYMDKLGLKEPQTIDEFVEMLRVFKNSDPDGNGQNDTIPWGMQPSATYFIIHNLSPTFGLGPDGWTDVDGKLVYNALTDNFKDMLEWLSKLYKEELIDHEYALLSSKQWEERVSTGKYAVTNGYVTRADMFNNLMKDQDPNFKLTVLTPFEGPYGHKGVTMDSPINTAYCVAISSKCKDVDAAVRYLDFVYSDKGTELYTYGVENVTFKVVNGKKEYIGEIAADPTNRAVWAKYGICQLALPRIAGEGESLLADGPATKEAIEKIKNYFVPRMPPLTFTTQEQEKVTEISAAVGPIVNQFREQVIMGEVPISQFEEFKNKLKNVGIDNLVTIYNDAYSRYKKLLESFK